MINKYRISNLTNDCVSVVSRQSEVIAFCNLDFDKGKIIIRRFYAMGNGEAMLFLLNYLSSISPDKKLYMYSSCVLEISQNCFRALQTTDKILMVE